MRNRVARQINRRFCAEPLESRTLLNAADLDTTFGSAGIATTQFNGYGLSGANAVAIQGDGKVVAAGYSASNSVATYAAIARYNTNGSLDATFGTGGVMQFAIGSYVRVNAIALQSDGKIVLAGATQNSSGLQFMVARLTTSGALDTTFNSTGYETFTVSQYLDVANCVAIQSNGMIVVGGQDSGGISDFALARLNANGGLDTTFGTGGVVTTNINFNNSRANACNAIAIDSSGRIDAAGAIGTNNGSATAMGYVQYSSSGLVNFVATAPVLAASGDGATSIAIQSNGEVLVGGNANGSIAVTRFSGSSADQSFGNHLGVFTYTANSGKAMSMNLLSSGSIVVTGYTSGLSTSAFILRLTSAGALDTTFDSTGSLLFGAHFTVYASAVRSTGQIDVAGYTSPPWSMTVQQFTSSGAADTTFGSGAPVLTDFIDPVQTIGRSAALQTDGKLVVGSIYRQSETANRAQQSAITRYNLNGTIDTTFGTNGSVFITSGAFCDLVGVVVQPNGDIVMEASLEDSSQTFESVLLERFLPSGALDTTFGVGGQQLLNSTDGYATNNTAAGLAVGADGSLYVLSISGSYASGVITKLTPSGQFDTTYGTAGTGIVNTTTAWTTEALDSSGRVIVAEAGFTARYNANGTLDTTFQTPNFSNNATAGSIITQPDGEVLISSPAAKLQRYTNTGAGDVTFGSSTYGSAGIATTSQPGISFGNGVVLPTGDVLAGGLQSNISTGISGAAVTAFNAYGVPISTFGTSGTGVYTALSVNNTMLVRSNGRVLIIGQTPDGKEGVVQILGNPQNVLQAAPGSETLSLSRSTDGTSINWTLGAASGSLPANDAAGLTIFGDSANDTINFADNTALPTILHLNGTFTLNGLTGTNPFAGAAIDIAGGTLFIPYAGPTADPMSNILADIKKGYASFGDWTGISSATAGTIGSTTAEGNPAHNTAVGYADSADGLVPLPANTIELKYTLYGDTGLTGSVGFTDFMRMTQHYTLNSGATWSEGDFNYDGSINSADFNLLQPNYGQTLPARAAAPTVTPPATSSGSVRTPIVPPPVAPLSGSEEAIAATLTPSATTTTIMTEHKTKAEKTRKTRH